MEVLNGYESACCFQLACCLWRATCDPETKKTLKSAQYLLTCLGWIKKEHGYSPSSVVPPLMKGIWTWVFMSASEGQ
eukprot:scaffold31709_cov19-Tisochrysis_lutea.AAC.1